MQVWQTRAQPGQYTWKFAPKRGDDPVAVGKFKVGGDDIVARQVSQYADMVKSVIGGIGGDITDIFDRKLSSDDWEFKITWVFVSEDRSFASVVAPEGAGWSLDRWGASSGAVVFLWRRKLDKAEPPGEDTGS